MSKKTIQFLKKRVLGSAVNGSCKSTQNVLEERAKGTVSQLYVETDPTVAEWCKELIPTKKDAIEYLGSLFPFTSWIRRYNLRWLMGDVIASLTIGFVVVPQAMAYALLANLSPEYGLYTSFVGAALYWLFGTSKDIVIGTTAIGSLLVGQVITRVNNKEPGVYTHEEIAKSLSMLASMILIFLGLFRLGWIIEFIPYVPISAFVTAASITIMSTQLPVVLGIQGINTREAPYLVLTNTLKSLGRTRLDAAIGITSIVLLFVVQALCSRMEVRQPLRQRMWATISSLRLAFTILLYTFISWLVNRHTQEGAHKFRIVGKIEPGFQRIGFPQLDTKLLSLIVRDLPAIVIIVVVEHIAIAKSFGRKFNYIINPSQEIFAQGVADVLGPFMGGYICTGSFGASAVLSKAGVRTPLAGSFSAIVLIIALYALTKVFGYIPMAALAGLIIHATSNLITPPSALYKYWQLSPPELIIWVIGVVLALFTSLETSIYTTISLSFAMMLFRLARTNGRFLGQTLVQRISSGDVPLETSETDPIIDKTPENSLDVDIDMVKNHSSPGRYVFLPIDKKDGVNPRIAVDSPYPGVIIYRFSEGFTYINQAQHMNTLSSYILSVTRRTKATDGIKASDRLWVDPGSSSNYKHADDKRPFLRAVVLDCSSINIIDITSIQGLIDLRNMLDKHSAPASVDWHFAGIHNRWTRRGLAIAGFGYPTTNNPDELGHWSPAYTVASALAGATDDDARRAAAFDSHDEEKDNAHNADGIKEDSSPKEATTGKAEDCNENRVNGGTKAKIDQLVPVYGIDKPFFHVDLIDALDAAVRAARRKDHALRD